MNLKYLSQSEFKCFQTNDGHISGLYYYKPEYIIDDLRILVYSNDHGVRATFHINHIDEKISIEFRTPDNNELTLIENIETDSSSITNLLAAKQINLPFVCFSSPDEKTTIDIKMGLPLIRILSFEIEVV